MFAQWLVLLPPLVILLTAFISHNVVLSVLCGIASAVLIATNFSLGGATTLAAHYFAQQLSWDSLNIYGFLIVLGALLTLINTTGGTCAFSNFITRHLNSAKKVESTSLTVSLFFGIDDYLNALTTGCIIKPLADRVRIPRVKLAFLLDIMASPLVVLVPISSWIALIVGQLNLVGINQQSNALIKADPFFTYLQSVPFIFYSFIAIASAWFIVRRRISFGPMKFFEHTAQVTGNLHGGKTPRFDDSMLERSAHASLSDFFLPLLFLIASTIIGILYKGGYHLFGGQYSFLQAFCHTGNAIFAALMNAACISFVLSSAWALMRKKITWHGLQHCIYHGFKLMYQSVILVFCALTFSLIINQELHTGQYLAQLIVPGINVIWLPLIIFVMSTGIALAMGSSWGTIGVSTPISIPMVSSFVASNPALLFSCIGAIISGAILGAQLSPISDPVTIASTSSGCYQLDHVKTQAPYILAAFTGSCAAFALIGVVHLARPTLSALVCMAIGIAITLSLLALGNYANNTTKLKNQ